MKIATYLSSLWLLFMAGHAVADNQNALLNNIKSTIQEYYVLSENIPAINTSLDNVTLQQTISQAASKKQVAELLTQHLAQFDKHFTVQYVPLSEQQNQSQSEQVTQKEPWFQRLARNNAGFREVVVKKGNVGVLEFWGFAELNTHTKKKIASAMGMLSDVDALIIDLRENGGGSGETVSWLTSYFVEGKVHLNSFYTRYTDTLNPFYTEPTITNAQLASVPLYILIGPDTFSAAEEFAYNLKHLGRATIVGMPSKGGANPWRWFALEGDFRIGVPTTQAINPITKSNWEGRGVQPDILISEDNALEKAYILALESLASSVTNRYQKDEINTLLIDSNAITGK